MKITIVAIGQRQPAWAEAAVADYLERFPPDWHVNLQTVRAPAREGQPIERIKHVEAQRLRAAVAAIGPAAQLIALDECGNDWTTARLARELGRWRDAGAHPAFFIGGADGLDAELRSDCALALRLSSMTLPHALARVVVVEQLYRAWSILAGHPYHRG